MELPFIFLAAEKQMLFLKPNLISFSTMKIILQSKFDYGWNQNEWKTGRSFAAISPLILFHKQMLFFILFHLSDCIQILGNPL